MPDFTAVDYRRLVESVTDYAIVMLDASGRVATWTTEATRITGFDADDIVGGQLAAMYPEEDVAAEKPARALETAAATGQFKETGWRLRKDGSRFRADVVISAMRNADGALGGFVTLTRDLSRHPDDAERRLLRSVIETLGSAVGVCDARGFTVQVNAAARALSGASVNQPQSISDAIRTHGIFLPDGVTPYPIGESTMARALRGEASSGFEAVFRNAAHPDGLVVSTSAWPMRDDAGVVIGAVTVSHDITERKRMENELRAQQRLLRSVLDSIAETVSVFDPAGALVLSNPAHQRIYGQLAAGTAVADLARQYGVFSIDGRTRLAPSEVPVARALRGETVDNCELLIKTPSRPDGVFVSVNAQLLRTDDDAVVGVVVTSRDVTAQRAAEAALAEQSNLQRLILDCLAEGVIVYDVQGHRILMNPAAHTIARVSLPDDSTLADCYTALHAADRRPMASHETAVARSLRGEHVDDLEMILRVAGSDQETTLSTTARPLVDAAGAMRGAVVTTRNITAQHLAEAENRALIEKLHRSNAELEQFAYVASHDLRAPLRAIATLSQWIGDDQDSTLSPDGREHLTLLRQRAQRMDQLLVDLLDYARASKLKSDVAVVDVARLVREVIDLAMPPSGFSVEVDDGGLSIETAALPLKRVLLNLVTNAIKHHDRSDGSIRISVRDLGDTLEFVAADDGPGIPPQFHERIFQMFQTLKPRDRVEGSGMGLALVRKLVEQAGGAVGVESEGRGTTFRFTWPKTEAKGG